MIMMMFGRSPHFGSAQGSNLRRTSGATVWLKSRAAGVDKAFTVSKGFYF